MLPAKIYGRFILLYENQLINFGKFNLNWYSSSATANKTPLSALKEKIQSGELLADEHQRKATEALEKLFKQIQTYKPTPSEKSSGFFGFLGRNGSNKEQTIPKGLYLYGSVGGGKTTLMDMFYDCCSDVGKCLKRFFIHLTF